MDQEPQGYSDRDSLTGLKTRGEGMELLSLDLERGESAAAIFCDLDQFVYFNRANGHAVGDELLRLTAAVLDPPGHQGHETYRLGGEEFLVRLPGADLSDAERFAEEARRKIKQLTSVLGAAEHEAKPLSARFGVVAWKEGCPPSATAVWDAVGEFLDSARIRDAVVRIFPDPPD